MKGILFKPEMIQAIFNGSKTQTRRIINPQPSGWGGATNPSTKSGEIIRNVFSDGLKEIKPKYKVGEIIYVKEAYRFWSPLGELGVIRAIEYKCVDKTTTMIHKPPLAPDEGCLLEPYGAWRNAMFMPEFASRLKLEIVAVRPERLQDITNADALAEGVLDLNRLARDTARYDDPVSLYEHLWDRINGKGAFSKNPILWVYEFQISEQAKES